MKEKRSFIFISCEEAFLLCDKDQYGEATFWERFKLRLRCSWCHVTQAYSRKNEKLSDTLKNAHLTAMDNEAKERIDLRLQKEIARRDG